MNYSKIRGIDDETAMRVKERGLSIYSYKGPASNEVQNISIIMTSCSITWKIKVFP